MIDVKSDKVRELKRDVYSLLKECMHVSMYETKDTVNVTLHWKMDGKTNQICSYEMEKRK